MGLTSYYASVKSETPSAKIAQGVVTRRKPSLVGRCEVASKFDVSGQANTQVPGVAKSGTYDDRFSGAIGQAVERPLSGSLRVPQTYPATTHATGSVRPSFRSRKSTPSQATLKLSMAWR